MSEVKESPVSGEKIDYERYVVRKALAEYWRAEEKVEIILMGMTSRIPVTMLCKLNNVSPSLYYEWREKFMAQGKEGATEADRTVSATWRTRFTCLSAALES
jgi:transposase-like protein